MKLFAITYDGKIVKIDVDAEAQTVVSNIFTSAKNEFIKHEDREIDFSASYSTSEDEYFCINEFDDGASLLDAIFTPTAIETWDPDKISEQSFKALFSGIFSSKNAREAYIQAFSKMQILDPRKTFIQSLASPQKRLQLHKGHGFSIGNRIDAIIKEDQLLFKSLHMVRRLFDMSTYFHEATEPEMKAFASSDLVHVENVDGFISVSDSRIKTMISLIMRSETLKNHSINDILSAAEKVNITLPTQDLDGKQKIIIPAERREIKSILRFLDQGYFRSVITDEVMETNSKKAVR